jgi:conjugal transfer pilus assembly protein TraD
MGSTKIKAQSTLLGKGHRLGRPQSAKPIWLPDADRKGHMFCFGSTRIGKTKLIELMIEQDIRKGYSVTLFDPKGDIALFSRIVQVAFEEDRQDELCLVTPIFPEYSAPIDPLAYYFMPEELVSHVVSGIRAKEEFFVNIAYETTLIIVLALLLFAKTRNEKCRMNLNDIKERASHACLEDLKTDLESLPDSPEKADILASLTQILDSPKDYFAKISSSLRTTLTSLSTGNVGKIIGRAQSNQFIQRLEQNKRVILIVQTGSLLTRKTAHIVARVLISMIQSFIGRQYASGRYVSPPLSIYLDEASNLMYIGIEDLFNKAGGAGAWVHAFTQSVSDLEAEIGRPFAKKILDNTNTKVFMRVNDPATAEYVARYSGEQKRFSPLLSLGGAITIREVKECAILPEHILNLQQREFFLFSYQGQYRGKTLYAEPPYFQIDYPQVNVF